MTGPAAVDGDGMQWAECEFWVEGRPQLRVGGEGGDGIGGAMVPVGKGSLYGA